MLRYAATIFLSAFLLFLVQPMIGKYILPWFGGAAGVWAVCLVFFQTALLAGYAYAHAINKWFSPRGQMIAHIALLLIAAALLRMMPPDAGWKPSPENDPTWRILGLLVVCLGVPYLALASTGPLLQAWFARGFPGRSPYRLYALSNAGSLLALLGYPFLFEPLMTRRAQSMTWSGGFVLFAALCGWCALAQGKVEKPKSRQVETGTTSGGGRISAFDRLMWFLLPACASIALVSSTAKITQDIAPIPFLWVVPLTAYLLSFIICFEWPRVYRRGVFGIALLGSTGMTIVLTQQATMSIATQVSLFALVLAVCCMVCHGEAYRLRPAPAHLTGYYLAIAGGGAMGGAFVAIIAPLIFSQYVEFELAVFGAGALMLIRLFTEPGAAFYRGARRLVWLTLIMLALAAMVGLAQRRLELDSNVGLRTRNFYGVLTIRRHDSTIGGEGEIRVLYHGWIRHRAQILNENLHRTPTLYFSINSGIGRLLQLLPDRPARVGIVGLGVGTLATYGRPGDVFRFYEINPEDIRLADRYFTFLDDSPAQVQIVPGDARLSLERETPQAYDVLALDAFSGDAIPLHLLTVEAFDVYQRHLSSDGVIAVHISNKYLDLLPVVRRLADHAGMTCVSIYTDEDREHMVIAAQWALLSKNRAILDQDLIREAADANADKAPLGPLWTDEHASLLSVLR